MERFKSPFESNLDVYNFLPKFYIKIKEKRCGINGRFQFSKVVDYFEKTGKLFFHAFTTPELVDILGHHTYYYISRLGGNEKINEKIYERWYPFNGDKDIKMSIICRNFYEILNHLLYDYKEYELRGITIGENEEEQSIIRLLYRYWSTASNEDIWTVQASTEMRKRLNIIEKLVGETENKKKETNYSGKVGTPVETSNETGTLITKLPSNGVDSSEGGTSFGASGRAGTPGGASIYDGIEAA